LILPPTAENIERAAEALRRGGLVGLPTETVYGVAADALNREAVRATYRAKGRPADNPLIVHLGSVDEVESVALWTPAARTLAERFWPGPLTLVLSKRPNVPDEVTAGMDSVALRVPKHPVALALLAASGRPLSAPSANPFMGLSPTRAEDIDPTVASHLAMILDGGPCEVGLESTVLDAREGLVVLRPGLLTAEALEAVAGGPVAVRESRDGRAPGQYPRHYAPRTPLRLVDRLAPDDTGITFADPQNDRQIRLPADPARYGAGLYAALHVLDRFAGEGIAVEAPPTTAAWAAVWDRLRKAAADPGASSL
jgi:L-threonylcarbamoyladenylate synthase